MPYGTDPRPSPRQTAERPRTACKPERRRMPSALARAALAGGRATVMAGWLVPRRRCVPPALCAPRWRQQRVAVDEARGGSDLRHPGLLVRRRRGLACHQRRRGTRGRLHHGGCHGLDRRGRQRRIGHDVALAGELGRRLGGGFAGLGRCALARVASAFALAFRQRLIGVPLVLPLLVGQLLGLLEVEPGLRALLRTSVAPTRSCAPACALFAGRHLGIAAGQVEPLRPCAARRSTPSRPAAAPAPSAARATATPTIGPERQRLRLTGGGCGCAAAAVANTIATETSQRPQPVRRRGARVRRTGAVTPPSAATSGTRRIPGRCRPADGRSSVRDGGVDLGRGTDLLVDVAALDEQQPDHQQRQRQRTRPDAATTTAAPTSPASRRPAPDRRRGAQLAQLARAVDGAHAGHPQALGNVVRQGVAAAASGAPAMRSATRASSASRFSAARDAASNVLRMPFMV